MSFLRPIKELKKNLLILMTGTFLGQVFPIAFSPILTRIYSPDDFGSLTLFIAALAILGSISSLRYEQAIIQPKSDEDSEALLVLSLTINVIFSVCILTVLLVYQNHVLFWLGTTSGSWIYLIPAAVFSSGWIQILGYWNTRYGRYRSISESKVAQGMGTALIQWAAAVGTFGSGLIVGYVGGLFAGLFYFFSKNLTSKNKICSKVILYKLPTVAKYYSHFPKYSAFGAILDNISLNMPALILNNYFDSHTTGTFGLTFRIMNMPMSLVATALSQVLFQKIAGMHHNESQAIRAIILKIFLTLLLSMIPLVGLIEIFGEPMFAFVFGESWRPAGRMAGILIIASAVRFAVSPLSCVLALKQNVRLGVLWQCIYFLTIVTTLLTFKKEPIDFLLRVFVIHEVLLYSLYFYFILLGAKSKGRN